jgi:hypothetical protein
MSKKLEREPDLIEFKVNYTLDQDLPVEKYFMAYNATEALKMFAHSCIKFLSDKKLSDAEVLCFTNSYAQPDKPCLTKPEPIPLPKEIPELDEALLDTIKKEPVEQPVTIAVQTTDPFADSGQNESLDSNEREDENIFEQPVVKITKPDPREEHSRLVQKRELEVNRILNQNKKKLEEYTQLLELTEARIAEISERINIIEFSEFFKWSDKWMDIKIPIEDSNTECEKLA